MNRLYVFTGLVVILFVVLTQIGWLGNGFYGFQVGFLPQGMGPAALWGGAVALGTLLALKIIRWWKS